MIQYVEVDNRKQPSRLTDAQLVQGVSGSGQPYDFTLAGDPRTYQDLVTPRELRGIARYADHLSAEKSVLIPRAVDGTLGAPSPVIDDAHTAGLQVVGWTFRRENQFLSAEFRSSDDPDAVGDLVGEIQVFLDAGLDAVFTDNPDLGAAALS